MSLPRRFPWEDRDVGVGEGVLRGGEGQLNANPRAGADESVQEVVEALDRVGVRDPLRAHLDDRSPEELDPLVGKGPEVDEALELDA
jgi:hypothetical protein